MTALAETPAAPQRLRRLGFVYIPMGCDGTPLDAARRRTVSTSFRPR